MRGQQSVWLLYHLPLPMQQEVENFKKVNMISREQFDTLTPEPPVDPNQEVPPGPPRFQQGKTIWTGMGRTEFVPFPLGEWSSGVLK